MKILIDLRIFSYDFSGISAYTLNLLKGLGQIDLKDHFVLLFRNHKNHDHYKSRIPEHPHFSFEYLDLGIFDIRNVYFLRKLIQRLRIEAYYTSQFFWPFGLLPCKAVSTIHDIIPLEFPELLSKSKKTRMRWLLKWFTGLTLRYSSKVFVDSEATLKGIKTFFGEEKAGRCKILFPCLFKENPKESSSKNFPEFKKWGIGGSFLLYVGRQDPYKNLCPLVEVFSILKKEGYGGKLVFAGKVDPRYPLVREKVLELCLEKEVIFTDFIAQHLLEGLLMKCDLVVQPSLVEGFGLTALEPFFFDKISVVSRIPSHIEILGENPFSFDPRDLDEMKARIKSALEYSPSKKKAYILSMQEKFSCFRPEETALRWLEELKSS